MAKRTRTNNLGRIKTRAFQLAKFPDPKLADKTNRGYHSVHTAQLITPTRLLVKFNVNPQEYVTLPLAPCPLAH